MIKPAKNIVPPPPATAPRAAAQKKQQLPRLHPTKKPVVKQLSGSTHFTAHVPTPASGLGGSRGLLGDPLGVGAGGGGARTFAQEQASWCCCGRTVDVSAKQHDEAGRVAVRTPLLPKLKRTPLFAEAYPACG